MVCYASWSISDQYCRVLSVGESDTSSEDYKPGAGDSRVV